MAIDDRRGPTQLSQCILRFESECESECNSPNNGQGKGENHWGLGKSGNEPGDKTANRKRGAQMLNKGQELDSGDVDMETIKSKEQNQETVRQKDKKAGEYEQMSESVLSAESIPLGHRQMIRRYFEMIRPQNGETDKVMDASNE